MLCLARSTLLWSKLKKLIKLAQQCGEVIDIQLGCVLFQTTFKRRIFWKRGSKKCIGILLESFFLIVMSIINIILNKSDWIK